MKPELASLHQCSGCGAVVAPEEPLPLRCPHAGVGDVDHVLRRELDLTGQRFPAAEDENPFVAYRALLHSYRFARRAGRSDGDFVELVREIDGAVEAVDGRRFRATPYGSSEALARELGLAGLWFKDETGGVAGSHKARHLMGVVLQLQAAGVVPERLAIASCGNAALAAAVLARACGWALDAFVPRGADPRVLRRLGELGARTVACERVAKDGAAGDPCVHAFRAALAAGALPFTVQGSENGCVIEGGETLGFELVSQHAALAGPPLDVVVVQVGGGALGTAVARALREARELGALARLPRIVTVQTSGAYPLERAWRLVARDVMHLEGIADLEHTAPARAVAERLFDLADADVLGSAVSYAARHRSRYMRPWEEVPHSIATGILDDETYDWLSLVEAMIATGGWPVVAGEEELARAPELAGEAAGVEVDATGAAGLAGLLHAAGAGDLDPGWNAAVLFTGGAW